MPDLPAGSFGKCSDMTYSQAVDYLYSATPQFQQIGAAAYKPGLDTVSRLSNLMGDSHKNYPIIHIAGTNGKGSAAHTLAAILQSAGYKTGLFTSPHLLDFRERIRVDGEMIGEKDVVDWLEEYLSLDVALEPSFFELTTVMAFDFFARKGVDVAVIETGLGGRLDSTNIVLPILSVITNVSKDHTAQLGNKLKSIAGEKAGIIKEGVPVVLGEGDIDGVRGVIEYKAREMGAPLTIASDNYLFEKAIQPKSPIDPIRYIGSPFGDFSGALSGNYQVANTNTVLHSVLKLRQSGWKISDAAVKEGFIAVRELTCLKGRWTVLSERPLIICDTGHNEGGWNYLVPALEQTGKKLKMVIGFVNDKDVDSILAKMPSSADYYFTQPSTPRALQSFILKEKAEVFGLRGKAFGSVREAVEKAIGDSERENDILIFIGGSTFVVADALPLF